VTTQLHLLEGGSNVRRLDARTRTSGRKGIEEARRRLAALEPPQPRVPGGELSQAS
jgi:hypothetical protein